MISSAEKMKWLTGIVNFKGICAGITCKVGILTLK